MKRTLVLWVVALVSTVAAGSRLMAQPAPADAAALRANVERRFDVLPLRDGVALRPRTALRDVRSIEITTGVIAVDGQPVSGAELRNRLGADADLVLQLSYLNDADRRALFTPDAPPAASSPSTSPAVSDPVAPPDADVEPPSRRTRRSRSRDDDIVGIGFRGVSVREGQVVDGDVVAVGGSARIDGDVRGDVVAVGGSVRLGPRANVSNNVVVIGGRLDRDPSSTIGGQVQEIGLGNVDFGNWRWPSTTSGAYRTYWESMFGSTLALFGTLTRLAIFCLLAAVVILIGHQYAERAGERATREPLKSGATGFLSQLLFVPLLVIIILVLVVTIVGIPLLLLLPFVFLALFIVGVVGFAGVAERVGQAISRRTGWSTANPYATTSLGIALIMLPTLLSRVIGLAGGVMFPMSIGLGLIGGLVEYLAWTIGFGALALARFDRGSPTAASDVTPATSF
jgi:hypothetical protein